MYVLVFHALNKVKSFNLIAPLAGIAANSLAPNYCCYATLC